MNISTDVFDPKLTWERVQKVVIHLKGRRLSRVDILHYQLPYQTNLQSFITEIERIFSTNNGPFMVCVAFFKKGVLIWISKDSSL